MLNNIRVFIFIIAFSLPAQARMLEGIDPSYVQKIEQAEKTVVSTWNKVKKTVKAEVLSLWNKYRTKTEEEKKQEAIAQAEAVKQKKIKNLANTLPKYDVKAKNERQQYIQDVEKQIQKPVFQVKNQGLQADPSIQQTQRGVPRFSIGNVKSIPQLNIGREDEISKNDLVLKDLELSVANVQAIKALSSPKKIADFQRKKWLEHKVAAQPEVQVLDRKKWGISEVVTERKISQLLPEVKLADLQKPKIVKSLSPSDLKMLAAMLIYKKGDQCHNAISLFYELSDSGKYKTEASYYLGQCAIEVGFMAQAMKSLSSVIKEEHKHFTPKAIQALAKNLPKEYEVKFAKTVLGLKNKKLLTQAINDQVNYYLAKGLYKKGQFNKSYNYAAKVKKGNSYYTSAQFLMAISKSSLGQNRQAKKSLRSLQKYMAEISESDKNLETLISVNLARLYFMEGNYQPALQNYLKTDKSHPLWVQALIEQGWAQVALGDNPGAIGNMYSLHSPYFKFVYMPESYAIRTIGYIGICQFGDAYSSLNRLEKEYRTWLAQISRYIKKNKLAKNYYFTVAEYLKGDSKKSVQGLPHQVIRELARQKEFLNYQSTLNAKVDEKSQIHFIKGFINKDRSKLRWRIKKAKERVAQLKANLKKAQTDNSLGKYLTEWKQQLTFEKGLIHRYGSELAVLNHAKKQYAIFGKQLRKKLNGEIYTTREKSSRFLVKKMKNMRRQMAKVLENNEFLRYEIYAGSGENIRFQVAGGVAGSGRIPASVKPPKSLKWDFAGEYWQDEIGSYRSTLKNNCPDRNQQRASL